MSDPFLPKNSTNSFFREAQLVFSVVFFLVVATAGWSFFRFSHGTDSIPLHIQNAPIALHVGPEYYKNQLAKSQLAQHESRQNAKVVNRIEDTTNPMIGLVSAEEPVNKKSEVQRTPSNIAKNKLSAPLSESNKFMGNNRFEFSASKNPMPQTAHDISQSFDINTRGISKNDSNKSPKTVPEPAKTDLAFKPIPKTTRLVPEIPSESSKRVSDEASPINFSTNNAFSPLQQTPDSSQRLAQSEEALIQGAENENALTNQMQVSTKQDLPIDESPERIDDQILTPQISVKEPAEELAVQVRETYETKKGDSFWSIAQFAYDDGRFYRALYEFNRDSVDGFDNLRSGQSIATPDLQILCERFPELCPGVNVRNSKDDSHHVYVTKSGDTLFDIARRETGQASRYLDLIRLNRSRLPEKVTHLTRLTADLRLQLPE